MSFNFDRESLSHCPKSYFDAIFNYYEVAQMLIKFCYILLFWVQFLPLLPVFRLDPIK